MFSSTIKSWRIRAGQPADESGSRVNWRAHNCAYGASDRAANRTDRTADGTASPFAVAGRGILGVSRNRQSGKQNCENEWFVHHFKPPTRRR